MRKNTIKKLFIDNVNVVKAAAAGDPAKVEMKRATGLASKPFTAAPVSVAVMLLIDPVFMRRIVMTQPGKFAKSLRVFLLSREANDYGLNDDTTAVMGLIKVLFHEQDEMQWALIRNEGFVRHVTSITAHAKIKWEMLAETTYAAMVNGRTVVLEVSKRPFEARLMEAKVENVSYTAAPALMKKLWKAVVANAANYDRQREEGRHLDVYVIRKGASVHGDNIQDYNQKAVVAFPYFDRENNVKYTKEIVAAYYRPDDLYLVFPETLEHLQKTLEPDANIKFVDVTKPVKRTIVDRHGDGTGTGRGSGDSRVWPNTKAVSEFRRVTGYSAAAGTKVEERRKQLLKGIRIFGHIYTLEYLATYRALHNYCPAAFANYNEDIAWVSSLVEGEKWKSVTKYEQVYTPLVHDTDYRRGYGIAIKPR